MSRDFHRSLHLRLKSQKFWLCLLLAGVHRTRPRFGRSDRRFGFAVGRFGCWFLFLENRQGRIYKLRSPSAKHLASVSTYDSSNPSKDWGFPELSMDRQIQVLPSFSQSFPSGSREKSNSDHHVYRDRAAERRALHGGFGVGPGQKKSIDGADSEPSSSISASPDEAAAESLNMSFGVGSYARRILESMGWKEGEALGNSTKGLTEPLQVVGNSGNAGLGWDQRTKHIFKHF